MKKFDFISDYLLIIFQSPSRKPALLPLSHLTWTAKCLPRRFVSLVLETEDQGQGTETAAEVIFMLNGKNMENQFPLFTAVHHIFINQMQPEEFIDHILLKSHSFKRSKSMYLHVWTYTAIFLDTLPWQKYQFWDWLLKSKL